MFWNILWTVSKTTTSPIMWEVKQPQIPMTQRLQTDIIHLVTWKVFWWNKMPVYRCLCHLLCYKWSKISTNSLPCFTMANVCIITVHRLNALKSGNESYVSDTWHPQDQRASPWSQGPVCWGCLKTASAAQLVLALSTISWLSVLVPVTITCAVHLGYTWDFFLLSHLWHTGSLELQRLPDPGVLMHQDF